MVRTLIVRGLPVDVRAHRTALALLLEKNIITSL